MRTAFRDYQSEDFKFACFAMEAQAEAFRQEGLEHGWDLAA